MDDNLLALEYRRDMNSIESSQEEALKWVLKTIKNFSKFLGISFEGLRMMQ